MIIVRLTGGLGNQMFQYAFGKALALRAEVPLKLDISLLGTNQAVEDLVVREYDLDVFDLSEEFASSEEIENYNGKINPGIADRIIYRLNKIFGKYPVFIQNGHAYDLNQISRIGKDACVIGRWQSELFFKEFGPKVRPVFSFGNFSPNEYSKKIAAEMARSVSVAVHVRRGDYITHPVYSKHIGALDKQYYSEAIALVRNKLAGGMAVSFFFISDDIQWCKSNFSSVEGGVFVEQEKGRTGYNSDLWLLSRSHHSIISNSTFSWWGAWLGEKKDSVIVAPANWAKERSFAPPDIIPDRWIKLENTFENS